MKNRLLSIVVMLSPILMAEESTEVSIQNAEQVVKTDKRHMTVEQRKAQRAARIAADGGMVDRPVKGKVVCVLLKSDKIAKGDIADEVVNMRRMTRTHVEVVDSTSQSKYPAGCLITLAEMGDDAPTLLCAPEDFWATVNISKLAKDNPAPELFKVRIIKELWRAVGYALGAANSQQQPCLMRPIRNVADLDSEKVAILTPMPMMAVAQTSSKLGFARGGQSTYRAACREGWAPEPTNDVQKVIWEEVHAKPTNPIKITFDPSKGE